MKLHLRLVHRALPIMSSLACALASVTSLLLCLWLCADMIQRQSFDYEGKPLWIGVVVLAFFGLFAASIAREFVRRRPGGNLGLVFPAWFMVFLGATTTFIVLYMGIMSILSFAVAHLGIHIRSTVLAVVSAIASLGLTLLSEKVGKGQQAQDK